MANRDLFAKQTSQLLQYLKVDIRTNKPLNVEFRYASHVASRYKTDYRLVFYYDCFPHSLSPVTKRTYAIICQSTEYKT